MRSLIKKYFYVSIVIGLVGTNILTLTNSAVHDVLFGALSSLTPAKWSNSPAKRHADLSKKYTEIKTENKNLKLASKRNIANKKKVSAIAKRITTRTARNAAVNISSIPAEAIPYLGVGMVVAVTTMDIYDACESMKDISQMMNIMGSEVGKGEMVTVCGQKQKIPSLDAINAGIVTTKLQYREMQGKLGGFLHDIEKRTEKNYSSFNENLGGTLHEIEQRSIRKWRNVTDSVFGTIYSLTD